MPEWLGGWISSARDLAGRYDVDPIIFLIIYFGAIPFFWLGTAWIIRSARRRHSVMWPALFTGFCFVSPYLYVLLFGRGLPWWVYPLAGSLILGFGWQSYRSLSQKVIQAREGGG